MPAAAENHHPGHISRRQETSHSHGLSKSARSHSSGRQRRHGQTTDGAVAVNSGRRTPQESNLGSSANRQYPEEGTSIRSEKNNSRQPSTKSNSARTQTTEEDSSLKSSASPEAPTSEKERSSTNGVGPFFSTPKQQLYPPPPPRPTFNTMGQLSQDNNSSQGNSCQNSQPIQLLKELGRKLVKETEEAGGASYPYDDLSIGMRSTATPRSRRPPTPKQVRDYQTSSKNDDDLGRETIRSLSTNDLSQKKRQQRIERSPSQRESTESLAAIRAEESNDSALGDASEIIARMDRLKNWEQPSFRTRKSRQQQNDDIVADTTASSAAGKLARAERRKEKAEKMASELRLRETMRRHEEDGQIYTLPMNDVPTRGREEMCMDDILKAAAEVRARARRSASRSRERLKEAAAFCGESPSEKTDYEGQSEDDQISLSSARKRSILNPHGLKDQPRPPALERRSQSRERRRNTRGDSKLEFGYDRKASPADERRTVSSRGNANGDKDLGYTQLSTAEELLRRRREMRHKIKERQSKDVSNISAQAAMDHLSLKEQVLEEWSCTQSEVRSTTRPSRRVDEKNEHRRGRSRSAIRDGLSKIRSASSRALRKKWDKGTGEEDDSNTIDSGRHSTYSFKSFLSVGTRRSLSRGRNKSQQGMKVDDAWEIESAPLSPNVRRGSFSSDNEQRYGDARNSAKSESFTVQSFFKRSLSRTRQPTDSGGITRSLSCGRFVEDEQNSWAAESEASPKAFISRRR